METIETVERVATPQTELGRIIKGIFDFRLRNQHARFISDHETAVRVVRHLQEGGWKIVMTQGVYDMTHKSHYRYLELAKSMGDFLIVGVDSDELTRLRKQKPGEPRRPIDTFEDRVEMLLHSRHVDMVTVRDIGPRLEELVEKVHPDILVMSKGTKDVKKEHIDHLMRHCGKLEWLEPQGDDSTTSRMLNLVLTGASQLGERLKTTVDQFMDEVRGVSR